MKQRDVTLDIIRISACVMIVLMHSPMPEKSISGVVLSGVSYLTAPSIGLFFMVSGALLLKGQPNIFIVSKFLKRRFSKILIPLVFWTAVGYVLEMYGVKNTELGILWFMYCLAGMYLLTPILSRWLSFASVRELELYLLLWIITMCVPMIKIFIPVNEGDTGWLYYFHGYVGYYVLGYYLQNSLSNRKAIIAKKRWGIALGILFVMFSVVLPIVILVTHVEVDFYSVFWYLSITVALQCVVWWVAVKWIVRRGIRNNGFIVELSKLSFGVYLIHILVMRNWLWKMEWMAGMSGVLQILVCSVLTFIISALISFCLSKVKYVKAVIGC